MKMSRNDIVIRLHLEGNDGVIDPEFLKNSFESIETALYNSDRKDIEMAAKELQISNVVRDACLERLRKYRDNRLILTEARSGSIEISGAVAATAFFLIEAVILEAIRDAIRETDRYKQLKDFFRRQLEDKTLFIAEHLRKAFSSKKRDVEVKALPPVEYEPRIIIVIVKKRPEEMREKTIRSLGEALD